jgi:hypothetical protein
VFFVQAVAALCAREWQGSVPFVAGGWGGWSLSVMRADIRHAVGPSGYCVPAAWITCVAVLHAAKGRQLPWLAKCSGMLAELAIQDSHGRGVMVLHIADLLHARHHTGGATTSAWTGAT